MGNSQFSMGGIATVRKALAHPPREGESFPVPLARRSFLSLNYLVATTRRTIISMAAAMPSCQALLPVSGTEVAMT